MISSAITVCLVPEARQGPFVFHGDLREGCAQASALSFDAVEVFAMSAEAVNARVLRDCLQEHGLKLAALGTGAGWVVHQLTLTSPDAKVRRRAVEFIAALIDLGGAFQAPAIVGSMQGRFTDQVSRGQALEWVAEALEQLGPRAAAAGVPLLLEPLNRYETNLFHRIQDVMSFLAPLRTRNVRVLADLFHMNIEEVSVPGALRDAGSQLGHVHWADSNRRAMGLGHTDTAAVAGALRDAGYNGYVSAEIFPQPDALTAARQTMDSFREQFRTSKP